jgi:hypothetical protein
MRRQLANASSTARSQTLTRIDVKLIDPHTCSGCLQVSGQPTSEVGIFAATAEKRSWRALCHEWSFGSSP